MMQSAGQIIPIRNQSSASWTAAVESVNASQIVINRNGELFGAKKMFSCVIEPEPGDLVLCNCDENGSIYIIGIVERPSECSTRVNIPGRVELNTPDGSLKIFAKDDVTIASENIRCFAGKTVHKSRIAIVSYDDLTARGENFTGAYKTIRLISDFINTLARQVIDTFHGYVRKTKGSDMVQAGQINRKADKLYAVESGHSLMKSKKTTVIDGEKILMG